MHYDNGVKARQTGKLLWMQCFVRAVETGSFSATARELGIGQPNVGRHIGSLESDLAVRLLHRTTRKLSLTTEGERYYIEARRVLDAIDEAESVARGEDELRGLMRVSCSMVVGLLHVQPLIAPLLARYPQLNVELHLSDEYVDLVAERFDLAVRVGTLKSNMLVARQVGVSERAVFASTEYLERHGEPDTPQDLMNHECILNTRLPNGGLWPFVGNEINITGRYRLNNHEAIVSAVRQGIGIGLAPVWIFEGDLRAGRVKALLPRHPLPAAEVHLVYPERRLVAKRTRIFMDAIATAFAGKTCMQSGHLDRLRNSGAAQLE
ncbi:LysR family transcriptional regulator [Pseudomonas orientalis]|uniref:DNA-binding transcriptional regulator, LysR family n=1 Tax=Pseudomonas orientalis TaxID=76758 RepID=A0A8B3XR65_9PSED|nr:LysR family transcriptional regulator [Pseudomonas orientalis]SDT86963.1 DNA-binding transcriptional regulator, LysR family [Pseudomonas orientalis]